MTMFEEPLDEIAEYTPGVGPLTPDEMEELERLTGLDGLYADDEKVAPLLARAREFQPDWLREHSYYAQPDPYRMCEFRHPSETSRLLSAWITIVQGDEAIASKDILASLEGKNRADIERELLEAAARESNYLVYIERCSQDHAPGIVPFDDPLADAITLLQAAGHLSPGAARNKLLKQVKAAMAKVKEPDNVPR